MEICLTAYCVMKALVGKPSTLSVYFRARVLNLNIKWAARRAGLSTLATLDIRSFKMATIVERTSLLCVYSYMYENCSPSMKKVVIFSVQ